MTAQADLVADLEEACHNAQGAVYALQEAVSLLQVDRLPDDVADGFVTLLRQVETHSVFRPKSTAEFYERVHDLVTPYLP